ncbi:hypothetical protein Tco_0566662 [Tanacetum coccineum]
MIISIFPLKAQSSLKAAESLSEYELKMILFEKMDKSRSYLTHDKHQALFDALFNSLYLDDVIARGQADPEKILRKRDHDGDDKDEDPYAGPNQGKKTKKRRTKESESSKKTSTTKETSKVAEPTKEVIMDTSNDYVVNDADQPQNDHLTPKHNWFTQPPRSPTPDPEWNKGKAVDDSQEKTWFNDLLSTEKGPLTFDELMATPIDFSKFVMNRLKIDKLTKAHLVGPVYNLLKGTCQSRSGHLAIASEYFFNNDLEYLKSSNPKKKYTTSITKTKAARYELVGIEDMIPSLRSVTKVGYDKDVEQGIKHWGPKRQLFYRSQINKFSKHDVYSTRKILKGDFIDLHLNDIEDMLLLAAQHKLFQLDGGDIVDLVVALRMFTRSIIIKRRVKDV